MAFPNDRLIYASADITHDGVQILSHSYQIHDATTAVLSVRAAGICTSDVLEALLWDRGRSDFGHEICAEILYTQVPGASAGARVVFNPNAPGLVRRSSGFSNLMWMECDPDIESAHLFPIPDKISDHVAALIEPLSCAHRAAARIVSLSEQKRPCQIGLVGCGFMGILIAGWLHHYALEVEMLARGEAQITDVRSRNFLDEEKTSFRLLGGNESRVYDVLVLSPATISEELVVRSLEMLRPSGLLFLYGSTRALQGTSFAYLDVARRNEGVVSLGERARASGSYGASSFDFQTSVARLTDIEEQSRIGRLVLGEIPLGELPALLAQLMLQRRPGRHIVRPTAPTFA